MRKRVKRLIAMGLGAVAVAAAMQGPAAADHDDRGSHSYTGRTRWYDYCLGTPYDGRVDAGGVATFFDHGDEFHVRDTCPDGHDVRVRWMITKSNGTWPSEWTYIHHTKTSRGGWWVYNYDMPERRKIKFQVGLERGTSGPNSYITDSYGPVVYWTTHGSGWDG